MSFSVTNNPNFSVRFFLFLMYFIKKLNFHFFKQGPFVFHKQILGTASLFNHWYGAVNIGKIWFASGQH
jgi:hypothetical protein